MNKQQQNNLKRSGFTLLELLIVIGLIATLMTLSVVVMSGFLTTAEVEATSATIQKTFRLLEQRIDAFDRAFKGSRKQNAVSSTNALLRDPDQDGDFSAGDGLLVFEILVGRDQSLETVRLCHPDQLPVLQIAPALLKRREDDVPGQQTAKWSGGTLVKEDFHPRSSGFDYGEALAREFQHCLDLLFGDTGKPFEELADGGPILKIIKQSLHRDAGAAKGPCAADLARHTFHC